MYAYVQYNGGNWLKESGNRYKRYAFGNTFLEDKTWNYLTADFTNNNGSTTNGVHIIQYVPVTDVTLTFTASGNFSLSSVMIIKL